MIRQGQTVLITGADGFIGSHLTEHLVRHGANVTALSMYNSFDSNGWLDDLPDDIRKSTRVVRGDIRDSAFVSNLCKGQNVVLHLAALIGIPYSFQAPQSYVDVNICGTLNVLNGTRDNHVERVVVTSTSEVYGTALTVPISESHPYQAQSPYSASKISADMMAESFKRSFDLPVVILRPFNTFGPRQSERAILPTVIRQALDSRCPEIRVGSVSPKRDLTFVRDTADAFLRAGWSEGLEYGTPYNVGSGKTISVGELIDKIQSLAGTNKPVISEDARIRPKGSEVEVLLADPQRFVTATGWSAEIGLNAGLQETIDWWSARLKSGLVRASASYMV